MKKAQKIIQVKDGDYLEGLRDLRLQLSNGWTVVHTTQVNSGKVTLFILETDIKR